MSGQVAGGRAGGGAEREACQRLQQKQAADSLIQVIQKLSKIVEKRPQRRCTVAGQKRAPAQRGSGSRAPGGGSHHGSTVSRGTSPCKRLRRTFKEEAPTPDTCDSRSPGPPSVSEENDDDNNNNNNNNKNMAAAASTASSRTVTCYQCSLCRFLSPTLGQLKEHLRQHDEQHSDLILMCSECHYTSPHQGELEAHVRLHFEADAAGAGTLRTGLTPPLVVSNFDDLHDHEKEAALRLLEQHANTQQQEQQQQQEEEEVPPQKKNNKWYSYEEYGLYRCLICSYVCSQQRMLKTHAWKHAGLVDCSYPIFEDDDTGGPPVAAAARREAQAPKAVAPPGHALHALAAREEVVVLSPALQERGLQTGGSFQVQLCMPMAAVENQPGDPVSPAENHNGGPVAAAATLVDHQELGGVAEYRVKDLNAEEEEEEEPRMEEVPVTTEADEAEVEAGNHTDSSQRDSLLSSAQKIISCSPNGAGHINVIVERLPSAEDSVMAAANAPLLGPDIRSPHKRSSSSDGEEDEDEPRGRPPVDDAATTELPAAMVVKEEVGVDWGVGGGYIETTTALSVAETETEVKPSVIDENAPPAGRTRTNSESLRLHSLVAEALVAMPMRTPELYLSSTKACSWTLAAQPQAQSPGAGQRLSEGLPALVALERRSGAEEEQVVVEEEEHVGALRPLGLRLGLVEADEEGPAAKAGISLSLLTVIERLRERSDQNASDEDILRELRDNARFHNGAAVTATVSSSSSTAAAATMASSDDAGGLVDYVPGSERPYRCRLCRYSSGNKGYIKQHLRVHRRREPYQCPICEHIALDSKDLESHMVPHCRARMYQCKQCSSAFHYKSQLRSHERENHGPNLAGPALTPLAEAMAAAEEVELLAMEEESSVPKVYKCDVCGYTSSTYVGVRNHRRIHNSDKPYRSRAPQKHLKERLLEVAYAGKRSASGRRMNHRVSSRLLTCPLFHVLFRPVRPLRWRCSLCGYVCSHPPSLKSHMWKHAGDQNYNYEQVNRAINEAMTQSSTRAPQKPSAVLEPVAERSTVGSPRDQAPLRGLLDTPTAAAAIPTPSPTTTGAPAIPAAAAEPSQVSGAEASRSPTAPQPHPAPASLYSQTTTAAAATTTPASLGAVSATAAAAGHAPGMEYCVLLFCCCICGFESTSKDRLLEHMKEHEGDIISIILNKEQQPGPQPAEGSAAQ
ncbi:hypothetical protein CRUP_005341 [Coryphaenoides rupestris]|nr:hypothetical protein CRUP_005341 [Coryphaenoides rupestris]